MWNEECLTLSMFELKESSEMSDVAKSLCPQIPSHLSIKILKDPFLNHFLFGGKANSHHNSEHPHGESPFPIHFPSLFIIFEK